MLPVHRFEMDIPDVWAELDLSGSALASARAELLATTDDARVKANVNEWFRQARGVLTSARKRGVLFSAGAFLRYDDGFFMGICMVAKVRPPLGYDLTLPQLTHEFAEDESEDRVVTSAFVPAVGHVARTTATQVVPVTGDVDVKMLTLQTVFPVPGTTGEYLVVTCSSPNLPLKKEVYDLFDTMTSSFRFLTEDGQVMDTGGVAALPVA
jgi:hypothetical protein